MCSIVDCKDVFMYLFIYLFYLIDEREDYRIKMSPSSSEETVTIDAMMIIVMKDNYDADDNGMVVVTGKSIEPPSFCMRKG